MMTVQEAMAQVDMYNSVNEQQPQQAQQSKGNKAVAAESELSCPPNAKGNMRKRKSSLESNLPAQQGENVRNGTRPASLSIRHRHKRPISLPAVIHKSTMSNLGEDSRCPRCSGQACADSCKGNLTSHRGHGEASISGKSRRRESSRKRKKKKRESEGYSKLDISGSGDPSNSALTPQPNRLEAPDQSEVLQTTSSLDGPSDLKVTSESAFPCKSLSPKSESTAATVSSPSNSQDSIVHGQRQEPAVEPSNSASLCTKPPLSDGNTLRHNSLTLVCQELKDSGPRTHQATPALQDLQRRPSQQRQTSLRKSRSESITEIVEAGDPQLEKGFGAFNGHYFPLAQTPHDPRTTNHRLHIHKHHCMTTTIPSLTHNMILSFRWKDLPCGGPRGLHDYYSSGRQGRWLTTFNR